MAQLYCAICDFCPAKFLKTTHCPLQTRRACNVLHAITRQINSTPMLTRVTTRLAICSMDRTPLVAFLWNATHWINFSARFIAINNSPLEFPRASERVITHDQRESQGCCSSDSQIVRRDRSILRTRSSFRKSQSYLRRFKRNLNSRRVISLCHLIPSK